MQVMIIGDTCNSWIILAKEQWVIVKFKRIEKAVDPDQTKRVKSAIHVKKLCF